MINLYIRYLRKIDKDFKVRDSYTRVGVGVSRISDAGFNRISDARV